MKNILSRKSAFTLIEMVVAITIFTIFISMVAGTYLYIARAQRDAGEIRKVYSGSRDVAEQIIEDVREGRIYYDCYEGEVTTVAACVKSFDLTVNDIVDTLVLVDAEGDTMTVYYSEDGFAKLRVYDFDENSGDWIASTGYESDGLVISSSDVSVDGMFFRIFPSLNPYTNFDNDDLQYKPYVTVYMDVVGDTRVSENFSFDLQTTISTRLYE